MRFGAMACALAVLLTAALSSSCCADQVTVTKTTLTIPTYKCEGGWLVPMPDDTYYPYPCTKPYNMDPTPTPERYQAVVLENDYLRMTVLPQLGCRIIQLVYKPTNQSVFYQNDVFKPWRQWMATGGMEFCFPLNEHSTNILKPWIYSIQKHPDGSATMTISDTHERTGMTESVAITLKPDSCALHFHIRLSSEEFTPKPFQFWINSMNPASDKTEIIVPTDKMIGFDKSITDWPVNDGVDYSTLAPWKDYNSLFADKLRAGFEGTYDPLRNIGVVRVFPFPKARGVKIFSYGHTKEWDLAPRMLTDANNRYFEMWGGYTSAFWKNATLDPHQVVQWSEEWYPIPDTGGLTWATADLAVNATIDEGRIEIKLFPTHDIRQARIVLGGGGRIFGDWRQELSCGKLFAKDVAIPSDLGRAYVSVYEGGRRLFGSAIERIRHEQEKTPKANEMAEGSPHAPAPKKKKAKKPPTFRGLFAKDRMNEAIRLYQSRSVPNGWRSLDYAVALMRAGRYNDALHEFLKFKSNAGAAYLAGTLALRKNDVTLARSELARAAALSPKDAWALAALGVTWAKDDAPKAKAYFARALSLDTNNLLALAWMADMGDAGARTRLQAALTSDPQNAAFIALDCLQLNALDQAQRYAEKAIALQPGNIPALASLMVARVRAGESAAADEALRMLRAADVEKAVVYGTDEAVMTLEEALRDKPDDSRLMIYLAEAYETRGSDDMALRLAERAAKAEPTLARAYFIQAWLLCQRSGRDVDKAIAASKLMDKCLALKPRTLGYYAASQRIYGRAWRTTALTAAMKQLNEIDPKCRLPYENMGFDALENENYREALKWFKLQSESPVDYWGKYGAAWVYTDWLQRLLWKRKYTKLAEVYKEASKAAEPRDMEGFYVRVEALRALGRGAEARPILEKMKRRKNKVEAYWSEDLYYLGCALDDLGDKAEAHSEFTKCLARIQEDMKFSNGGELQGDYYMLALTQNKLGHPHQALKTLGLLWKSFRDADPVKAAYAEIRAKLR